MNELGLTRRQWIAGLVAMTLMPSAWAQSKVARTALETFTQTTQSAQGQFTQQLFDKEGLPKDKPTKGHFSFLRPGKFTWVIEKPYPQRIVCNGQKLWLYDPDLMQVTVKAVSGTISATPASILFGDRPLDTLFDLEDDALETGVSWVKATPKSADASFAWIRVGFEGDRLYAMDLMDHFGQRTRITIDEITTNLSLKASSFEFEVPKGVDVLEDSSHVM